MKKSLFLFLTVLNLAYQKSECQSVNHWETAVFNSDNWRYWIGTSDPGQNWWRVSFDDSYWPEGEGGFGYGDGDDNTIIPNCWSVFLRIRFSISDTSIIAGAILHMDYDDGFVAYLNGEEIVRSGVIGVHPPFDQGAMDHEVLRPYGQKPESFYLNRITLRKLLKNGENVLSIEVHNEFDTSSDLSSNAWLSFGITDNSTLFRNPPEWFTPVGEFITSELPIVNIRTTSSEIILDEPRIQAEMKVIDKGNGGINNINDPGNIYSGNISIEIRGKYSSGLPQKPYGLETQDASGNNLNVPLLGMPDENDWILTANFNDKSFLRNFLPFELFRKMGHYAPRTRYCEVVVNDQYQGIYLLGEKIKQDNNRVNISRLTPIENSGDDLTGGYIFVTDYYSFDDNWLSNYSPLNKPGADVYFVYYDPEPEDLTSIQKNYLRNYVNTFEGVLYGPDYANSSKGYRAWLDVPSFIDYFIIGELSRNVDAYKKSRFFYKDRDSKGGLIYSGPPWDFDWAWKDITEDCINFNQTNGSGWAYRINDCEAWPTPPSWEIRLLQDEKFANQIHDRYFLLRKSILSEEYLDHVIDSVASLLDHAQQRHYEKWQILGINVGTGEYGDQPDSYAGEIVKFKNWIKRRLAWLDANMVGESTSGNEVPKAVFTLYPNPVKDILNIQSDILIKKVEILSLTGAPVIKIPECGDLTATVSTLMLKPGLYIVMIYFDTGEVASQKIIKK